MLVRGWYVAGTSGGRLQVLKFPKKTRPKVRLNKTVVDAHEYDERDRTYTSLVDSEIPGFEVRAYPGTKTWCLRYRSPVTGKQRVLKIGSCAEFTAHQARTIAAKARGLVLAGEDPQDVRDEAKRHRRSGTIGDISDRWIEEYAKANRKTWETDKLRLFPNDKSAPVYQLHKQSVKDRDEIVESLRTVHEKLADTPVAANRLLSTFNTLCNHATKQRWVTGLRNISEDIDPYPEKGREDYLRPAEFKKFVAAVDAISRNKDHWRSLIRFLLYTGCRYSEATNLRKDDVFRDAGVLIFRDTKNGTDHELPLTPALRALIDESPEHAGETVWIPMESRKAFAQVRAYKTDDRDPGFVSFISPHALRHTLRTTMLVELHIGLDIVDAVTNHKSDYGAGSRYVHVSKEAVGDAIERYVAWIAAK